MVSVSPNNGSTLPKPPEPYMGPSTVSFKWIKEADGSWADPKDNSTDDLYEDVIRCGIPLLEIAECLARGYTYGSPIAMMSKMLGVAACDAPKTSINTGITGKPIPLNLMICLEGASGMGKGATMGADLKCATPMNGYRPITPASGEALIAAFFEQVPSADGKGVETVRHDDPMWADWGEIDQLAAKTGNSNSTLDSVLRSLFTGERVGDESITRKKLGVGCTLEAGSYRFVMIVGAQTDHAGVFLNDPTGGILQRLLWIPLADEDGPEEPEDAEPYRRRLEKILGRPKGSLEMTPPCVSVWGPHSEIVVSDEVIRIVRKDRMSVVRKDVSVDPLDTHVNNLRLRLAAIFASWRSGVGGKILIDMDAWYWAGCVLAISKNTREECKKAADAKRKSDSHDAGKTDAERSLAKEAELIAISEKYVDSLYQKILTYMLEVRQAPRSDVMNKFTNKYNRKYFDEASKRLMESSDIREIKEGRARVFEYIGKH